MKIIFGWDVNYESLVENSTIERLKDRRLDALLSFAIKVSGSERFGDTWFKKTPSTDREVRTTTRNTYVEKKCRTERSRNNPLHVMTRLLNQHLKQ